MPVYHARRINVRLGSMPLAETTTSDVVLKKGEVAKRQSEAAEKKLLRSGYLNERRVLFPGDNDGFELNWLGNAPFMQAQVDPGFTQSSGPYSIDQDPKTSGHSRLQALTLHVKLSDKAFLSGINGKTHLKIEVLFNGQLSTCSLIHTNDIRSGAKSLHQVFAGYRVDFLAERPWILLPPFTTADGGTRRFRKTSTPTERWEEVSAAIMKEAGERGTDKYGDSPPSAAFLHALASMNMPECVKTMQKPGGRKFGVFDVVITAGYGNKLTTGTNYLKRPQRLRDSSYAVRTEIRSDDEIAAAEPDDLQDTTDKILDEMDPNDANGADVRESDAVDKLPHERRAFSSVEGLPQYSPNKMNFQSPLNIFTNRKIPVLPPPIRHTFRNSLSRTAGTVSPRCPSPEHRGDGHKEPLPANDRDRTHDTTRDFNTSLGWKSDASRIFQEYHCPPEPKMHALQTGAVGPTLPSMSLAENMDVCGPPGRSPFVGSPSPSSPMPHACGHQPSPPTKTVFPGRTDRLNSMTRHGPSTPFLAPTTLISLTPPRWSAPPHATTPQDYHPMDFQQQPQVGSGSGSYSATFPPYMPLTELSSHFPQTPPQHIHSGPAQFTIPITSSPPFFQQFGQLPPTAMFSVPSKPRRSPSSNKGATVNRLGTFRNSVLISRFIVTGRNGKSIVDHVWKVPQSIYTTTRTGGKLLGEGQARTSVLEHRESVDDVYERNVPFSKSSQATPQAISFTKKPPIESAEEHMGEQRRDSVVEPAIEVPLPYLKRHQGPVNEASPVNAKIDVPDNIAPFVPAHLLAMATSTLIPTPLQTPRSLSLTQPTVPQRQNFSRNNLPGIQGPKAATFLFDDPEEVLREAARMRRSRSPTKPAATPPVLPFTSTAYVDPKADQAVQGSSSPLTSVPSSPLSEKPADVVNTADAATDQIAQLDGSPERTLPATSPRKLQTPSPMKPSFASTKLQRSARAHPQSAISPSSKKRKASQESPTRPPRSPDRLKTVDNPPLNDDCVIALAESVDKNEERGVLRQVKGKRQGVFREDYVALAVRFFVAGD